MYSSKFSRIALRTLQISKRTMANYQKQFTGPHSAEDLSSYFTEKVDTIRASTAGAPTPIVEPRSVSSMHSSDGVTIEEVRNVI